jgi:hypothetical protein
MRAGTGQSANAVRLALAPRSVGEGFAIGLGWLVALPGRWWAVWQDVARRLADDPAAFVNHR